MACKGCEERLKKLKEMREIYMRLFRGGACYNPGPFDLIGYSGYWWSFTAYSSAIARYRGLGYSNGVVSRNCDHKQLGLSVRCVRVRAQAYGEQTNLRPEKKSFQWHIFWYL